MPPTTFATMPGWPTRPTCCRQVAPAGAAAAPAEGAWHRVLSCRRPVVPVAVACCDGMHVPASSRREWRAACGPSRQPGALLGALLQGWLQHEADAGPDCSAEASASGLVPSSQLLTLLRQLLRGLQSSRPPAMQDYVRTGTYYAAILENAADFEGKVVMDVGAGSGILSLFAAQVGLLHLCSTLPVTAAHAWWVAHLAWLAAQCSANLLWVALRAPLLPEHVPDSL